MKKHILTLCAALTMTGAFTACTDTDHSPMTEQGEARKVSIRATIDGGIGSRVALEDDAANREVKVDWKAGDDFKINVNGTDYTFVYNETSKEFEYDNQNGDFPATFTEAGTVTATYPATTPTAYASQPGTLEGAAALLTMTATLDVTAGQSTEGLGLVFKHTSAIVKLTLTNQEFANSPVTVSFYADGLLDDAACITSSPVTATDKGTATVYLTVPPTDTELTTVSILATCGENHYTASLTAKQIVAGNLYNVTKTMTAANYLHHGNTYIVFNATGLQAWNTAVQSNKSLNLTLAADITLPTDGITVTDGIPSKSNWTVFGGYTGTIDGAGHKVTGLRINDSNSTSVGFVRYTKTGVIKNLHLVDPVVYGSNTAGKVGAIVGYLQTNNNVATLVSDCSVTGGSVTGMYYVGGIAGMVALNRSVNHCMVTGCSVAGVRETGNMSIGGIVGYCNGRVLASLFLGETVTGNVEGSTDRKVYVGGIVGETGKNIKLLACGNTGTVSTGTSVGGIVGYFTFEASGTPLIYSSWTKAEDITETDNGTDGIGGDDADEDFSSYVANCFADTPGKINETHLGAMNSSLEAASAPSTPYRWQAATDINTDWPTLVIPQ